MARLLVVHHSPTPHLRRLAEAVVSGARDPLVEGVELQVRPALEATVADVLDADGYLLGTPANLGYMAGALKHFFDTVYNDCLGHTERRPWGLWVHGATDTTGARLAVERIVTGLGWRSVAAPVEVIGEQPDELERCGELGSVVAATLMSV